MGYTGQGLPTEFFNGAQDFTTTPGDGGVGPDPDLASGILVLNNTATASVINSGLASHYIVYLKGGQYAFGASDQLVIPEGKQLIGLNGDGLFGGTTAGVASILWTGALTADGITMDDHSVLKNIHINFFGTEASGTFAINEVGVGAGSWIHIERIRIQGHESIDAPAIRMRSGRIIQSEFGGVLVETGPNGTQPMSMIVGNYITIGNGNAGIELPDGADNMLIAHNKILSTGHGILKNGTGGFENVRIHGNDISGGAVAGTNGLEGFGGANHNVSISENTVRNFTGAGAGLAYNLAAAVGTNRAAIRNNIGFGNNNNTGTIPGSWLNDNNTAAS